MASQQAEYLKQKEEYQKIEGLRGIGEFKAVLNLLNIKKSEISFEKENSLKILSENNEKNIFQSLNEYFHNRHYAWPQDAELDDPKYLFFLNVQNLIKKINEKSKHLDDNQAFLENQKTILQFVEKIKLICEEQEILLEKQSPITCSFLNLINWLKKICNSIESRAHNYPVYKAYLKKVDDKTVYLEGFSDAKTEISAEASKQNQTIKDSLKKKFNSDDINILNLMSDFNEFYFHEKNKEIKESSAKKKKSIQEKQDNYKQKFYLPTLQAIKSLYDQMDELTDEKYLEMKAEIIVKIDAVKLEIQDAKSVFPKKLMQKNRIYNHLLDLEERLDKFKQFVNQEFLKYQTQPIVTVFTQEIIPIPAPIQSETSLPLVEDVTHPEKIKSDYEARVEAIKKRDTEAKADFDQWQQKEDDKKAKLIYEKELKIIPKIKKEISKELFYFKKDKSSPLNHMKLLLKDKKGNEIQWLKQYIDTAEKDLSDIETLIAKLRPDNYYQIREEILQSVQKIKEVFQKSVSTDKNLEKRFLKENKYRLVVNELAQKLSTAEYNVTQIFKEYSPAISGKALPTPSAPVDVLLPESIPVPIPSAPSINDLAPEQQLDSNVIGIADRFAAYLKEANESQVSKPITPSESLFTPVKKTSEIIKPDTEGSTKVYPDLAKPTKEIDIAKVFGNYLALGLQLTVPAELIQSDHSETTVVEKQAETQEKVEAKSTPSIDLPTVRSDILKVGMFAQRPVQQQSDDMTQQLSQLPSPSTKQPFPKEKEKEIEKVTILS